MRGRGTTNVEAYEWFLKGREVAKSPTREGNVEARPLFERAIELGCKWEAITTGGRLAALAREHGARLTTIEPGHQPRAALPLLLVPLLRRLPISGITAQLAETEDVLGATGAAGDGESPVGAATAASPDGDSGALGPAAIAAQLATNR